MDKLKLQSPDVTTQNIEKLKAIFPTCVSEAKNDQGEIIQAIDFDLLKQELSKVIVEGPQERYRLDWPGKREALLTANAPIAKTLRPAREESVNFDSTKNLFIEGDNLDALKLLQETYLNKVKMIYIDPPYNTGNDFVYKDNFAEDSQSYLVKSNQQSNSGEKLVANPESSGRFHSDWLSMIYPRLKLARNLLRDDGVIFISIDESEFPRLKQVCDEVFGGNNAVVDFVWVNRTTPNDAGNMVAYIHEYIVVYARDAQYCSFKGIKKDTSHYKNPDNDPNGPWIADNPSAASGNYTFQIINPFTGEVYTPPKGRYWAFSEKRVQEWMDSGKLTFSKTLGKNFLLKKYLKELKSEAVPVSSVIQNILTMHGTKEFKELFGGIRYFKYPKPTDIMQTFLRQVVDADDLVCDFFAGSGTFQHSVFKYCCECNIALSCISIQIAERLIMDTAENDLNFLSIADLSKERIRRAGQKIKQENPDSDVDIGFRVLKIDSSNMVDTYYRADETVQGNLQLNVNNIKADRSSEDLLFQVLLSWGVDLTLPIEKLNLAGKEVYCVDDNALLACFDDNIDDEWVKHLAQRHPLRVVFKDTGFANDAAKINVGEVFKLLSPETEVKTI